MFKILISENAKSDLGKISSFYQMVSPKLKKKFLANFQFTLQQLKYMPFFEVRYDNFRMRQVLKFPVIIHFVIDQEKNTLKVFGIRHAKQNPENQPKT